MKKPVTETQNVLIEPTTIRFFIASTDLKNILSKLNKVGIKRPSDPSLENYKVVVKDSLIEISVNDLENEVIIPFKTDTKGEGTFLMPLEVYKLVSKFTKGDILTLECVYPFNQNSKGLLDLPDGKLTIENEVGSFSYAIQNPYDYPNSVERPESLKCLYINSEHLKKSLVDSLSFANDTNNGLRPAMNAVHFYMENETLDIMSTDAFIMLVDKFEKFEFEADEGTFMIDKKSVMLLTQFVDTELRAFYSNKYIWLHVDGVIICSRLTECEKLGYKQVIPNNIGYSINNVYTKDFIKAVELIQLSEQCYFTIDNNRVISKNADFGREFKQAFMGDVVSETDAEPFHLKFDKALPALKCISETEISLDFMKDRADRLIMCLIRPNQNRMVMVTTYNA